MFTKSTAPRWLVIRSTLLFGVLGAVLAGSLLQSAGPLREAQRAEAAAVAEQAARVSKIELIATAQCAEIGRIPAPAIARAFNVNSVSSLGQTYASGDADRSKEGTVAYSSAIDAVSITAVAQGDCSQHGRRLGGMSPWLGGAIGTGCGVSVRIATLAVMLAYGVPVNVARTVSEGLGGFVSGAFSQFLITGQFSSRTVAAGMFGALTSTVGGAAARKIVGALRYLPRQSAVAMRSLSGDAVMSGAGNYIADSFDSMQTEWSVRVDDFMRNSP